ncbi:hypothetical protein E2C01_074567 [Portunus trituberculatus]|uniref:Uncharacterized protein n=1 Tax=Portunus trituberculatus TaxID=210409 RepID=A0A5B7IHK1_PORTR|nr:hypothetical protein [Portunus trituberculatus]
MENNVAKIHLLISLLLLLSGATLSLILQRESGYLQTPDTKTLGSRSLTQPNDAASKKANTRRHKPGGSDEPVTTYRHPINTP